MFCSHQLDDSNWCFDFGALKPVKAWLHEMFDHTMIVADDDPERERFEALARDGLVDIRIMPSVGCEATAKYVYDKVDAIIRQQSEGRVWTESVEVKEHGGNSAIYSMV